MYDLSPTLVTYCVDMRNGAVRKMAKLMSKTVAAKNGSHVTAKQFHELVSITNDLLSVTGGLLAAYDR